MGKFFFIAVWILIIGITSPAQGIEGQVEQSLLGLKTVKIVVDMNVPDPELLVTRMRLLRRTFDDLVRAGIKPSVVVAFRGRASRYVTVGDKYVPQDEVELKGKVTEWVETFRELGFTLEQCGIAAELQKIDRKDFLPQLKVVENGYVSLVGYQNQGYAFLPMD